MGEDPGALQAIASWWEAVPPPLGDPAREGDHFDR